jgi:hypothetical protein
MRIVRITSSYREYTVWDPWNKKEIYTRLYASKGDLVHLRAWHMVIRLKRRTHENNDSMD